MEQEKRHYYLEFTRTQAEWLQAKAVTYTLGSEPGTLKHSVGEALSDGLGSSYETRLELGQRLIRKWYYSRVRSMASEALANMLDGTLESTDALEDWLRESVDGTDIVVYSHKAEAALMASDNSDAIEQDLGSTAEQRAYYAMRADVQDLLQAFESTGTGPAHEPLPEGFKLDDSSTWTVPQDEGRLGLGGTVRKDEGAQ